MGFSEKITNQALASCGRCCCICHKFCGTKMELHHIKQKAYGGEDSLENCIPLCFDCHSDMGKADPKHPKGKHYSEEELMLHRDNWYKKVADAVADSCNTKITPSDIEIFKAICELFTPQMKYWLNEADIGSSHPYNIFDPLVSYLHRCDDPFEEFVSVEMEKFRGALIDSIKRFLSYKAINTFVRTVGETELCVTREWMVDDGTLTPHTMSYKEYSKQYAEEAQMLNDLATNVWTCYCDFVRQGRRILSV